MARIRVEDTRRSASSYGSRFCICPKCGNKIDHPRGVPCSSIRCTKCGAFMKGEHCADLAKASGIKKGGRRK
ncbi:MAG: hypothetical protein ACUVV6_03240 [Thermoplasmatota archaeon]